MSATKIVEHTPGPWNVGGKWPSLVAIYHDCVYIAHAETGIGHDWIESNPIGLERARANARLIAAAPDLLRVVRAFLEDAKQRPAAYQSGPVCHLARVTIANAEGLDA